jgi:predicted transcriptional regulator
MYSHVIRTQVEALQKAGLLKTGVTIDQAERCIQKACWSDQIAIVWTTEDVLEHARQLKVKITKPQAMEILSQVQIKHDASLGINWDTVEFYIREAKR